VRTEEIELLCSHRSFMLSQVSEMPSFIGLAQRQRVGQELLERI